MAGFIHGFMGFDLISDPMFLFTSAVPIFKSYWALRTKYYDSGKDYNIYFAEGDLEYLIKYDFNVLGCGIISSALLMSAESFGNFLQRHNKFF